MNQYGIDEFLPALRSLSVKTDDISSEPLKLKYSNVALYITLQRKSTLTMYEDDKEDDMEEEQVGQLSHKLRINETKKTLSSGLPQEGKCYVHKPHGRKLNILYLYELIN